MIHYVTVGVALERPPKTDEYRRYAIYGGTHHDAELVALQMAACTSTMPVEVQFDWCDKAGCKQAETEPHGALGCSCWPADDPMEDDPDADEAWQVADDCPLHGECGDCANDALRDSVLDLDAATPTLEPSPPVPPTPDPTPVECTCQVLDVSTYGDGSDRRYIRGRTDPDCPLHRGLEPTPVTLSPGETWCLACRMGTIGGTPEQRLAWLAAHRHTTTEKGPRQRGLLAAIRRWIRLAWDNCTKL